MKNPTPNADLTTQLEKEKIKRQKLKQLNELLEKAVKVKKELNNG